MRNADRRATAHQFLERGLDNVLGLGVQRIGGLIQNQNRSIADQRARDGETLALAAGKGHTLFADDGVEATRFFEDEIKRMGMFGGGFNVRIGRAGPAEFDVAPDGFVEQNGFLGDHGDMGAEVAGGEFPDVGAADAHRPFLRVVKAEEQIGQGRFARAAAPDEGHQLAGFDGEVDAAQDGFFMVGEFEAVEPDVGVGGLQRFRLRGFGDGALSGEQFKDARAGGLGLFDCIVEAGEIFDAAGT